VWHAPATVLRDCLAGCAGADRLVQLIPLLGIAGTIVGLVLMIRIYRADPEPDQRAWRYRERD
jgi:hypothetical protein